MKIIGLDLGAARIGIAVADSDLRLALPRPAIAGSERAVLDIAKFAAVERAELIVLGLPRSMSGRDSRQTKLVREFAQQLGEATKLRIELADERLTTRAANQNLRGESEPRTKVDSESARILLQDWLDAH